MKTPREKALELCQSIDHDWQETDGGYYCVICHTFVPYECGFEDDLEDILQGLSKERMVRNEHTRT